jgi:hypothetical protein
MKSVTGTRISLLIFLALISGQGLSLKAQASLGLQVDTPAIRIGEQVNALLTLSGLTEPARVRMPLVYDTLARGIEILEQQGVDTVRNDDGTYTLSIRYRITSFDSGSYIIRNLAAQFIDAADTTIILAPPVTIDVFTVTVAEDDELRDIRDPFRIPLSWREVLPWILLVIGILSLIIAYRWYRRQRRTGKPMIPVFSKPSISAHERALAAFEELRRKKLWQEGRYKEYHSELTDILRKYIDERFGIPAMEMVSWEILDALEEVREIEREKMSEMHELLTLADMVKFAKALPLADESDRSLRFAVDFVKNTIPKEANDSPTGPEQLTLKTNFHRNE